MKNNWSPEFEDRIKKAFEKIFADKDVSAIQELRRMGLSEFAIENGIVAGLCQMVIDGEGAPGVAEFFTTFKKEYPARAEIVLNSITFSRGNE